MSGPRFLDEIRIGFSWIWGRPRSEEDREVVVAVDAMLSKAFSREGYSQQSRDDYLALVSVNYRYPPDVTQSFLGNAGTFAICYNCEREPRGLHIHSIPNDRTSANQLLDRIDRQIGTPALRSFLLRTRIPQLTLGHKFTVFTGMYAIIGTIVGLTASF